MEDRNHNIHEQLVQGVKSGSYEDFNRLYAIYADILYGFVLNLTKSPTEARDVLQETFLRVWNSRHNLQPEQSFKAYLYTISRHLVLDTLRNQVQSVAFEEYINSEAFQGYAENGIEQGINFDDFCYKLELAKRKLTDKQQEVFNLSREKGLSIADIAQQLGVSEKTVKNQLSLSLRVLKEELSHYYLFLFLFL